MNEVNLEQINLTPSKLRHGKISKLASRGQYCVTKVNKNCEDILDWVVNGLEAGKFFPRKESGFKDPFAKDDVVNAVPPPDGKIASAGHAHASILDEQSATRWEKHSVKPGEEIELQWNYTAKHPTRRWNYFITEKNWNPEKPLSRKQFEDKPFYSFELQQQPFWNYSKELMPKDPTIHKVSLPNREGYHIILGVWEIADTGNAFYQVIDVIFE